MSDYSALSVGLPGLEAQQVAEGTIGGNVANANTAGYGEESVQLGALPSTQTIGFYTHGNRVPRSTR